MSGDLLSVFEGAAVLQVSGNPGRSECMAAGSQDTDMLNNLKRQAFSRSKVPKARCR
jgi:hypothetical protein